MQMQQSNKKKIFLNFLSNPQSKITVHSLFFLWKRIRVCDILMENSSKTLRPL